MDLVKDKQGEAVQAFPLQAGRINLTSGTYAACKILCCAEDGSVALVGYGE